MTDATKKGLICCDCDGTLFQTKHENFNKGLFGYLIALKNSGYEVVIFSGEHQLNERRVGDASLANTGDVNFFEYDDAIVLSKQEIDGPALAVFDDNHGSHWMKTDCKLDPNNIAVRNYITQKLEEYAQTGQTEFNPDEIMAIQLAEEARLRSEINNDFAEQARGSKATGGSAPSGNGSKGPSLSANLT